MTIIREAVQSYYGPQNWPEALQLLIKILHIYLAQVVLESLKSDWGFGFFPQQNAFQDMSELDQEISLNSLLLVYI